MPTLTLQQSELGPDRYRISVSCSRDLPDLTLQHEVDIDYRLDPVDQEAIRWNLEDFLSQPHDPNPKIAARTEQRMAQIGSELFEQLFDGRMMIEWWGVVAHFIPLGFPRIFRAACTELFHCFKTTLEGIEPLAAEYYPNDRNRPTAVIRQTIPE